MLGLFWYILFFWAQQENDNETENFSNMKYVYASHLEKKACLQADIESQLSAH